MLAKIVDWIFYSLLSLSTQSQLIQSLNFFVYDSIKIILLLFVMISLMGFIRSYIPQKRIRKWLTGKKTGVGNFFAAIFGALTPFCSCSSIPIFLSLVKANIPLGISFSFLITSPLVNEYLVALMLGFFGLKITIVYVISGILIGVISGMILGRLNLAKYLVEDIKNHQSKEEKRKFHTLKERINFGLKEAKDITKKLWFWILVGVGLGALIHNYVPREFIESVVNQSTIYTVPLVTLLGVPMYGSCAAIVPIAVALFNKGVSLGTALAFMMATAALSLPAAIILRRAIKLKLIIIFFSIVTIAIIITGYVFNFLQASIV